MIHWFSLPVHPFQCVFKLLWQRLQVTSKLLNLTDAFLFSSYLTVCKELEILNIGIPKDLSEALCFYLSDSVHFFGFKCYKVNVYLESKSWAQSQATCNFLWDWGCPLLCIISKIKFKLFRDGYMAFPWPGVHPSLCQVFLSTYNILNSVLWTKKDLEFLIMQTCFMAYLHIFSRNIVFLSQWKLAQFKNQFYYEISSEFSSLLRFFLCPYRYHTGFYF